MNAPGLFISFGVDGPPERSGRGGHLVLIVLVLGAVLVLGGDAARGPCEDFSFRTASTLS